MGCVIQVIRCWLEDRFGQEHVRCWLGRPGFQYILVGRPSGDWSTLEFDLRSDPFPVVVYYYRDALEVCRTDLSNPSSLDILERTICP